MEKKFIKRVIQFLIAIPGIYLIIEFSSWHIAVGIVLLLWANNIDYKKESDEQN